MTLPVERREISGVSVVVRGEGIPVFLMHGIGGNAGSCAALAEELSAHGYRTYCWDAPGYGLSADPAEDVDHAALALQVITKLESQPVHVFGTSWGGVIGVQLAARAPENARSLTLADSTRGSAISAEKAQNMLARIGELESLGAETFAETRSPRLVSPSASAEVSEAVRAGMAQVRLPGYSAAAAMMARTDTTELLPKIRPATLVIVGADDVVTGVDESQRLASLVPESRFEIIPQAGHAALQEKPVEMAKILLEFFEASGGHVSHDH